jgi:hypothetical protein
MQRISAWAFFCAFGIMVVSLAIGIVGAMTKSKSSLNSCAFCCLLAAVIIFGSFAWAAPDDRKITTIAGSVCVVAWILVRLWARKLPEEQDRFD